MKKLNRWNCHRLLLVLCIAFSYARLYSQAGSLDLSFDPGTGALGNVEKIALQPDGKILIAGDFTAYNGTPRNRIARLNTDGSLDMSFDPGTGATAAGSCAVYDIALQADGKMIIVGTFTSYNGNAINRVARVNADGSFDASFNPGTGSLSAIYSTLVQADGKIVIGGNFIFFNGAPISRIARLNADGSLDGSFDPGAGANASIRTMALQGDGKILIGADFTLYDSVGRNYIARINADGSLDSGFDPGTGAGGGFGFPQIRCIRLQTDGKVIATGYFTEFNGMTRNRIVRLNTDGSVDPSFDPGSGADNAIQSCALQSDGKILIGGNFGLYDGDPGSFLAVVNPDGSADTTFNSGTGANNAVEYCAVQGDGKLLIGGSFGLYNGVSRGGIARLNSGTASSVSPQEENAYAMVAFPNPFADQLSVRCENDPHAEKRVILCDMQGRVMQRISSADAEMQLDTRNISPGMYVLQVATQGGSSSQVLVKR